MAEYALEESCCQVPRIGQKAGADEREGRTIYETGAGLRNRAVGCFNSPHLVNAVTAEVDLGEANLPVFPTTRPSENGKRRCLILNRSSQRVSSARLRKTDETIYSD
jgi:hypothetical protein